MTSEKLMEHLKSMTCPVSFEEKLGLKYADIFVDFKNIEDEEAFEQFLLNNNFSLEEDEFFKVFKANSTRVKVLCLERIRGNKTKRTNKKTTFLMWKNYKCDHAYKIGELTREGCCHTFKYEKPEVLSEPTAMGWQPIPGFPDTSVVYPSDVPFPIFDNGLKFLNTRHQQTEVYYFLNPAPKQEEKQPTLSVQEELKKQISKLSDVLYEKEFWKKVLEHMPEGKGMLDTYSEDVQLNILRNCIEKRLVSLGATEKLVSGKIEKLKK
jgi:hypothetical protein